MILMILNKMFSDSAFFYCITDCSTKIPKNLHP